jgi:hypothetical protein
VGEKESLTRKSRRRFTLIGADLVKKSNVLISHAATEIVAAFVYEIKGH